VAGRSRGPAEPSRSPNKALDGPHIVTPYKLPQEPVTIPFDHRRWRAATASGRVAWTAVAFSFSFFGVVVYWPQLSKHHLSESTIAVAMLVLIVLSLITSIYVVALAYRFTVARVFGVISLLMNIGLVAILAFIY
tara:strand:+ start:7052 stop:7456 length:405 start_codon:yes stop_codon:yes gene_type:complete